MDLANLQISVTSKGVDSSLTQIDKLATTASTAEKSVSALSASFNANGGLSNNIKDVGVAAKSASTELAVLVRQLNSIGVNKLSDLVKATTAVAKAQDSLNKSKGVAYEAWEKEEKAIANVKTANQKLATELQKTNTETARTSKETSNAEIASIKSAKATLTLAEAHKNSTKSLSSHTAGWIHHMAVVSGGIVLYQALRFAMLSLPTMILGAAIKSVSDYQDAVIGMSAMYATLAKNQGDIVGNYQEATRYSKAMIPILMEIDNYTSLNLQDLIQMNLQFAAHGVAIDGNNKKQVQGFTNIANALVVLTKGQATSRQINQEVRAIMDGTTKSSDQLSLKLDILLKGRLKEMSKEWRKIGAETGNAGLIVEKYGELLAPFSEAAKVMEGTWSNVTSSMKTTFDILAIDAFSPIFEEWTKKLKEFNDEARNSKTVAETVNGSIELLSTGVGTIGGVIGSIFGTLWSLMVDFGNQVVKSLGIDMMDLFSEFQNGWQASSAIFASAGAAILVVIESIRSGIKQIGITAGGAFSQVANLLTLGGQGDSQGWAKSKVQYNDEVTASSANITRIQKDLEIQLYNIKNSGVRSLDKTTPKLGFDLLNTGGDDKTGANKAAKAEKNLREERERLASQVEDLIGKENFVTKAIREMEKGEDLLSKARTKGAIDQSKYSEGLAVLMKRESEAIGKPFTDIINKYKFVKDSSEQYAKSIDTIEKNQKTLTEEYNKGSISSDLYKAKLKEAELAYNSTIEEQIRDINKIGAKYTELKNDTGGYVKALETLQNKLENAKDQRVKDDVARVNDLLIESYNKEVLAKYGVVLATTKSVDGNKKLIASTNDVIKAHDNYVKSISGVLNEVGPAAGLSSGFITNMTDALDEFNKGAILGGKNIKGIASAIQAIGSQFGGRVGDALVGMGVGLKALLSGPVMNEDGTVNTQATAMQTATGIGAIGNNLGKLVGGETGDAISSGSQTGTSMYTLTGNPYIAIASGTLDTVGELVGGKTGATLSGFAKGGIVGGILGYFGQDSEEEAARNEDRQSVYDQISENALNGGIYSSQLMKAGNYTYSGVGQLVNVNPLKTLEGAYHVSDEDNRLLYDSRNWNGGAQELSDLSKAIDLMDTAAASIARVITPSMSTAIDAINTKFEYSVQTVGTLATLEKAKMLELTELLTGFSVDSTSSVLDEIITSTDPSKVGDAFAEKMTEGLATSLRQMEISKFATTLAEQTLTPLYEEATRMMLSGGDSSTALAAVNDGLISVSQQVTDFANNLDELGISGYNAAGSTTALTTATTAADVATARLSYQISLLSGTEKDAAATAAEAWGIENELIALLGDTASARERELALLSPLNRALKEMVYAISDAQSAASNASSNLQTAQSKADAAQSALESAYNALNGQDTSAASNALADAKTAVSDALSALSNTINAQKESLTEQYNAATELINSQLTATKTTLDAAESISASAKSFLSAMTSETLLGRKNAQADLAVYLNDAQRGVLPDSKKFSDTLSVLSQDSQQYFSSSVDWARDYYTTANKVAKIGGIAETKQTEAQKAITVAEEQLAVMKSSYENSIASLEAQYASAEAQVAALDRVNSSVMSLSEALLAYKNAQAETGSSVTSAVNNASSAYEKALADNAVAQAELAAAQQENTTAQATLTAAMNAAADALSAQKVTDTAAANASISQQPVSIANTAANALYGSVFGGVTETQISAFTADAASTGIGSAVKDFWLNPSVLEKINSSTDPLEEAYRLVLGRESDQEGKSFWQSQMATGATISNVITDFLKSLEYSKIKNIRGYATGGISTGTFIAGDINGQGGEIIDVGSNSARIYNNADSKKMLDNSDVVSVINALREEVKSLRAEVAKGNGYAKDTADATGKMNRIGIKQIA